MFAYDDEYCEDGLDDQLYFLICKRKLGQQYSELLCMPTDFRVQMYNLELKAFLKEKNDNPMLNGLK